MLIGIIISVLGLLQAISFGLIILLFLQLMSVRKDLDEAHSRISKQTTRY
jgi:predicted outer membrane lipoprotein